MSAPKRVAVSITVTVDDKDLTLSREIMAEFPGNIRLDEGSLLESVYEEARAIMNGIGHE